MAKITAVMTRMLPFAIRLCCQPTAKKKNLRNPSTLHASCIRLIPVYVTSPRSGGLADLSLTRTRQHNEQDSFAFFNRTSVYSCVDRGYSFSSFSRHQRQLTVIIDTQTCSHIVMKACMLARRDGLGCTSRRDRRSCQARLHTPKHAGCSSEVADHA